MALHPYGLLPAPGTYAAAGFDLGRLCDELFSVGTCRADRVARFVERRERCHQIDVFGLGNGTVEGHFPADLHQNDVEGREGERQPDDVEQRRDLVASQRREEVMESDFHSKRL